MLYSYVPSLVKCRLYGIELVGLAKDTFITIEPIDPVTTFRKAQDGSHTAFIDTSGSYRVTISLEQVSESNEYLHTLYKLHRASKLNLSIPLEIEESINGGGTQFNGSDCFFENEPTTEYGSESGVRQWVFICHNASYGLRGTVDSGFIVEALRSTVMMIETAQSYGFDMYRLEQLLDLAVKEADKRLKEKFG